MTNDNLTLEELARQVEKHLNSLRQAGVEWLPRAEAVVVERNSFRSEEKRNEFRSTTHSQLRESSAGSSVTLPEARESMDDELFTPEPPPDIPAEQRRIELQTLAEEVAGCTRCKELAISRTQTVFGDGDVDPEICFVGEAPGRDEDEQGVPFVGAAGKLLDRIIEAMGFARQEVYICNILRCRPPQNRTPKADEAANCREYLEKTIELVRPKYIVALGACAAQNLLQTTQGIGRLRKRFHDFQGIPVLCTYHPAFLLRSPDKKRDVWEDMKMLLAKMGRPVPERKKQP